MDPVVSGDNLDVSLVDQVLLTELELTISLMVAANGSEQHLTPEEIDDVLGVAPLGEPRPIPTQRNARAQAGT